MFHVTPIHPRPARILARIFARARLLLAIHHAANFVKVLRRDHPKLPQVLGAAPGAAPGGWFDDFLPTKDGEFNQQSDGDLELIYVGLMWFTTLGLCFRYIGD